MTFLYALLVGIDRYSARSVPDLRGCVNDIDAALAVLRTRAAAGTEVRPLVLRNEKATRAAVVNALRSHLGQAGKDDTALFWFSGHGSEAPVPPWAWFEEPTGWLQTLVCTDSRTGGVPDLWDKELSVLLDEIAVHAGHVAVVLDSCHSGGATRELEERQPAARVRAVRPIIEPPARESLLPELATYGLAAAGSPAPDHVALAASRSFEAAQEMSLGGRQHGLFSWALLQALGRLGPAATYRELLTAAQTEVERRAYRQVPQLSPTTPDIADQPFLGGTVTRPSAGIVLRYAAEGWEINAGSAHGLPAAADGLRVGVPGERPTREAKVVRVLTERSLVEPVGGWAPEPDKQFRVVLTGVPLPATTVAVDGDAAAAGRVLAALRTAGPGGGPSPHVRPIAADDDTVVPELRVVARPDALRIVDRHGEQIVDEIPDLHGAGTERTVDTLEHIARWRQVLDLSNPVTQLTNAVQVEIVEAQPTDATAPQARPATRPDSDGVYRLTYRRGDAGWQAPEVFIRLHNTSDRKLFCVLLDLTGRFRIHATLFPGEFIGPGCLGAALRGKRIRASLPDSCEPEPGRSVKDWLKLFVAEEQFSAEPFLLPPLGRPVFGPTRGALAARGPLARLGRAAVHRDLDTAEEEDSAYDWTTSTIPLITCVPE